MIVITQIQKRSMRPSNHYDATQLHQIRMCPKLIFQLKFVHLSCRWWQSALFKYSHSIIHGGDNVDNCWCLKTKIDAKICGPPPFCILLDQYDEECSDILNEKSKMFTQSFETKLFAILYIVIEKTLSGCYVILGIKLKIECR